MAADPSSSSTKTRRSRSLHGQPRNQEARVLLELQPVAKGRRQSDRLDAETPQDCCWTPANPLQLRLVESQVIIHWQPPLNLTDVITEWTAEIKAARKLMADEARGWRADLQT
jgi:hypothetical protein